MQEVADGGKALLDNKESSVEELEKYLKGSEKKIDKAYPSRSNQGVCESIEMLVVVFSIVMGIRAIVFQPFQIPTGSMQPTLFGVHFEADDNLTIPGKVKSFCEWVHFSTRYVNTTIRSDGMLQYDEYRSPADNRYVRDFSDIIRDATIKLGSFSLVDRCRTYRLSAGLLYSSYCSRPSLQIVVST